MTHPLLPLAAPEELGVDRRRWREVQNLLARWIDQDKLPAASVVVGRQGRILEPLHLGRLHPQHSTPLPPNALFLTASLTKPLTVAAVLLLVERGEILLDEPVATYLPRFAVQDKVEVTIRHLMTHTSGLPDQLPNNQQLRMEQRPFADFITGTCEQPLRFPPGTRVAYQSMGTAILGELVRQITGLSLRDFLHSEFFEPLGLIDTHLGRQNVPRDRFATVRTGPEVIDSDWHWNSDWWLGFGAPWGGLISTAVEFAVICRLFLDGGTLGGRRYLSPAGVTLMTTNQLDCFPNLPADERRCRPWALGWRMNWPGSAAGFGDLLSPRAYGHWGATGTLAWIDPTYDAFAVILTTQPHDNENRLPARLSNAIVAAFE